MLPRLNMATANKRKRQGSGTKARRARYSIVGPDGKRLRVKASMQKSVDKLARAILSGEEAAVVPTEKELTTQEAADLIGISRQFLVQLVDRGTIPATKAGTHRRLRLKDVLDYIAERRRMEEGLREIVRLSEEMGLYDLDLDHVIIERE
jgi:excisionase family DNA binding protein